MKIPALAAIAVLGFALSGCASIIKGSSETIAVSTPPVKGASCVLSSSQGRWHITSPAKVKVKRSQDDIDVHCKKAGYQEADATIPSDFEAWTAGNLLLGGVIGLGVDAATGAINKYPNSVQVPMQADDGTSDTSAPAMDDDDAGS